MLHVGLRLLTAVCRWLKRAGMRKVRGWLLFFLDWVGPWDENGGANKCKRERRVRDLLCNEEAQEGRDKKGAWIGEKQEG
jgi:hypothetical protein